ncbi:MAG TPA: hypothetical protein VI504_10235, partial [Candidatus Eisenbacteria bacterium]
MRRGLPSFALLLALFAAAPRAHAAPPVFRVTPDTLRADWNGIWQLRVLLENHAEWGLYPDSVTMEMVREDPDSSEHPRREIRSLDIMVHTMSPASAGDATGFSWGGPAEFERGSLVFRIVAHDAQKAVYTLADTVRVLGSALADAHPPVLLDVNRRQVEMTIVAADSASRPAPAVLFVAPSGTPARSLLRWALGLRARRLTAAVMSLPG